MKTTHNEMLTAIEVQAEIRLILRKAATVDDAEKGALSAAIVATVQTYGPVDAINRLRDLADVIERDLVLPRGEVLQ
jgi:RecJ-like exonuclease